MTLPRTRWRRPSVIVPLLIAIIAIIIAVAERQDQQLLKLNELSPKVNIYATWDNSRNCINVIFPSTTSNTVAVTFFVPPEAFCNSHKHRSIPPTYVHWDQQRRCIMTLARPTQYTNARYFEDIHIEPDAYCND